MKTFSVILTLQAAVELFPFQGDRDLGTRFFERKMTEINEEYYRKRGNMKEFRNY
jgi:hypothetical protein